MTMLRSKEIKLQRATSNAYFLGNVVHMERLDPTLGPFRYIVDFYGESDARRTACPLRTDESMVCG